MSERQAFEHWIIGFAEGEGSFTYRKSDGYPFFTITQNDKEILEKIKGFFGFGRVSKHCGRVDCKAWRYVVDHNLEGLNKLREFFQGRLRTSVKRKQFKFWVGLFNPNHPIRLKGREHERIRSKEYWQKNREKRIEASRRWRRNNPEKVKEYKRRQRHKRELERRRKK